MSRIPQIRIPATYMRGGTSKGVFFNLADLPEAAQQPGEARDRLLLRVIGSPDPYGKHTDGMGGATSSTSKAVIVAKSDREGHDVDYLFGQVSIDQAFVDWSGNCGNLSAAVGAFAIAHGLVDAARVPENGVAEVRIWQVNIGKTIVNHVPIVNGEVQETGDFELDGVAFPAAEVPVDFVDPADKAGGSMFPTGNLVDDLEVPGVGTFRATMINAGIPTIFLDAGEIERLESEIPKLQTDFYRWDDPAYRDGVIKPKLDAALVRVRNVEHPEWFKLSFLDLREDLAEAGRAGKLGIIVYFGQEHCPYCQALMQVNFGLEDIVRQTREHFDVIGIDIWGSRTVTDLEGNPLTEREYSIREKTNFTPSLIFYDGDGRIDGLMSMGLIAVEADNDVTFDASGVTNVSTLGVGVAASVARGTDSSALR